MHILLERLLKKRGIDDLDGLSTEKIPGQPSERETFEEWNKILSRKDKVEVDDIKEFCKKRISEIQKGIRDPQINPERLRQLATMLDVFSSVLEAINAPKAERERVEKYIDDLVRGV